MTSPLLFIFGVALSSFVFSALGVPVSVYAKEVPEAMMPLDLIRLPMTFLCGVFAPIGTMPAPLQPLAYLLPLTYSIDALRGVTTGPLIIQAFVIDVVAMISHSILFLLIATKMLKER